MPRPSTRSSAAAAIAVAVSAIAGAPIPGTPVAPASVVAQQSHAYHLPHLVSAGYSPTLLVAESRALPSARPHGMVSFGESVVEIQSLSRARAAIVLGLHSVDQSADVEVRRQLDPLAATSMALRAQSGVTFSNYAGLLASDVALGAVARTYWDSGAAASYESPTVGKDLVVPLFATDAYSHTSILQLTNTSARAHDDIVLTVFDAAGRPISAWTFRLEPGESGRVDPYYESEFRELPVNAGLGYLGAARIACDEDTAVMVYGDEPMGRGATAYLARPAAAADRVQYLPLVRANIGGDSLIGIVNVADVAADVTVSYLGAAGSPSGAGRTFEQSLTIGPRHHAFIDLDTARQRGSVAPAALPRGSSRGRGFFGGATVRASAPVLAVSLEQDARRIEWTNVYTVLASAAYNAFGPGDLSHTWIVPQASTGRDGRTTDIVMMNPGPGTAAVRVEWGRLGGAMRGPGTPIAIAPGQIASMTVAPGEAGEPVQAVVRSDAPIAVLTYDLATGRDLTASWAIASPPGLLDAVPTAAATPSTTATRPAPTTPPPTATTAPSSTATPTHTSTAQAPATTTAPATPTQAPTPTEVGRTVLHLPIAFLARR